MDRIKNIEYEISELREQLRTHVLYTHLKSIEDIKTFMQNHIFAVWDFMSLLKALQQHLTVIKIPWTPVKHSSTCRFINEIVLGEECDLNEFGEPISHFQMYIEAMNQIGANTSEIQKLVAYIESGYSINIALSKIDINLTACEFVKFTFEIINTKQSHLIASAFTFGREDIIPDIFLEILNGTDSQNVQSSKLRYYLERHIELDADEHGPLSLLMISELCGDDNQKWEDVLVVAKQALFQRIALWDSISNQIINQPTLQTV